MKLKLFKKLFVTTACVFLVTMTLVFVLLSVFVSDEFAKSKYEVLNKTSNLVAQSILSNPEGPTESLFSLIDTVSDINDIDIFVADNNGRIHACSCDEFISEKRCKHTTIILGKDFLSKISFDGKLELSSIDGVYDRLCYSSSKKISIGTGKTLYIMTVSNALTATDLIKSILGMYAISALLPIAFMFALEYSLMYRLTRPLKYMSISAKAIAQGDFSKRVPVMSNDEIGELSILFNKMSESLSRTETTSKSFIANISHELKTPMTTIGGFIDGIIDGTIEESRQEQYLKIVSDEVKRLSRLVHSMLSLSRLESGTSQLVDSNIVFSESVISVVVSMEQRIEEKNLDIIGLDELTETSILVDADLMYQVIYNLVDNAVKFTPNNESIYFSLHRINNNLEFKIKNTGCSIPPNELPHIFEKFYKIDKSRSYKKESLGLGLYICKTIVEQHGGSITVNCKENEFTEFIVLLPINYKERR